MSTLIEMDKNFKFTRPLSTLSIIEGKKRILRKVFVNIKNIIKQNNIINKLLYIEHHSALPMYLVAYKVSTFPFFRF